MFDKFVDYMYYLLFSPLKKVIKKNNQFYIFFKVLGKLFDRTKEDIFRVREEAMIVSASEDLLHVHGAERDMPRLKGEDIENYRMRLMMKNIIAEEAGTKKGILTALRALGYDQSYIEPYYLQDPERWAEFIVYLGSKAPSGINDIAVIDAEVMKVKPARSKPNYGIEEGTLGVVRSSFTSYSPSFPLCNTIVCGVYPEPVNRGAAIKSIQAQQSNLVTGDPDYPFADTILSSEKFYERND